MHMPMMNNHMTPTLTLNYLTGGSCISLILQTNGTEATVYWSIPPNTMPWLPETRSCAFLSGTKTQLNCLE